ncbi:neuronal acetylcholine receptor subunit alpha-10-like isoform X2 [Dreissena polymorpha]|uniref:neuronal acetylcholine receptor subunit alpha-10-like isoform X2 n=1 Tax=Dreissena polymorpha TaxID=45954 RepID=UPI0022656A9B|nr:neuronal acetylcholine receptor subunit alpha-10-like isoform X2 [Dreissena polymorpha]
MTARDGQLVWNPALYDGLEMIRLPSEQVWQPDIMLENNANQFHGLHSGDINMVITYDGFVFYAPPVKIHSYCKVNYAKLKQGNVVTCKLTFLSWTYGGDVINLLSNNDAITTSDFDTHFNPQWQYVTSNVERDVKYYACCVEPYIKLKYVIKLRYVGN